MLKLIYTEIGVYLEPVSLSLQDWVQQRISFSLAVGQEVWVESSRGSILLPQIVTTDPRLINADLSFTPCDEDTVEISLWGLWLTPDPLGAEGVLGVELDPELEQVLLQIWQDAQVPCFIPLWD